jgi:hypothetical protein
VANSASFPRARLTRALQIAADLSHAAIVLRFLIAVFAAPEVNPFAAGLLLAGGAAAGFVGRVRALVTFALLAPFVNGCGQLSLLAVPAPVLALATAVWCGAAIRRITQPSERITTLRPALGICDLLRLITAMSLLGQLTELGATTNPGRLTAQAIHGFGDPLYPVTSALIWSQGLSFLRMLTGRGAPDEHWAPDRWLTSVVHITVGWMLIFVAVQQFCGLPERWTQAGLQAPFEDISSFGSIAVACAIYLTATLPWKRRFWIGPAVGTAAAWGLLVVSWSRAAWLAGTTFVLLVVFFRAPRWVSLSVLGLAIAAWATIAGTADADFWRRSDYRMRLSGLARLENPIHKDPSRFYLYQRAIKMIAEKPLLGHGIGTFFALSPRFAEVDDPWATRPDFAHNFLLQFGAELGVPALVLLAALLGLACARGLAAGMHRTGAPNAMLGATLAVGAYLQTQLTANSLNVYPSNQFFLWFLVATLLVDRSATCPDGRTAGTPNGRPASNQGPAS